MESGREVVEVMRAEVVAVVAVEKVAVVKRVRVKAMVKEVIMKSNQRR